MTVVGTRSKPCGPIWVVDYRSCCQRFAWAVECLQMHWSEALGRDRKQLPKLCWKLVVVSADEWSMPGETVLAALKIHEWFNSKPKAVTHFFTPLEQLPNRGKP